MTIARIELSGNITSRTAKQFKEILSYAENTNRIKGVILVINSGGGEVAPSEILATGVKDLRHRKPIYSVIEGTGASGAYWIASSSTKIYAMSTSILGSIGVIGMTPNVKELMEKLGIRVNVFKVGKFKDMLTPFTEASEEAKAKYLEILENAYAVLKNSVSENRKLSPENLEKATTGEIFSARTALELGLIDKIGNFEDALADMSRTYQIRPKVRIIAPARPLLERMVSTAMTAALKDDYLR